MTKPHFRSAAAAVIAAALSACSDTRTSHPQRTATEQILLSTAVDRAVKKLVLRLPPGTRVFLDASRFEAYDRGYAVSAVRDRVLESGAAIADTEDKAQVIVEIRSGALSTNENQSLVGIPSYSIPIPLAGDLELPEIALLKQTSRRGIAKIGFTAYWIGNGSLADRSDPVIGVSGYDDWSLLGLGWRHGDEIPSQLDFQKRPPAGREPMQPDREDP